MCRGNFRSSWAAEGGYDFVAEALFNELEVDGFFMECDDERSGGFEPLRFVPKGESRSCSGLVTTKRGELEAKDELKRRIEEAAKFAPLEQLCLSPQCGFSSTVEGNALTEDEQWAKLAPRRRGRRGSLGDVVTVCSSCGTENRADAKFCGDCGAAFAALCPACGSPIEAGTKFCGECGAALSAARPPRRSAAAARGAGGRAPAGVGAVRRSGRLHDALGGA